MELIEMGLTERIFEWFKRDEKIKKLEKENRRLVLEIEKLTYKLSTALVKNKNRELCQRKDKIKKDELLSDVKVRRKSGE